MSKIRWKDQEYEVDAGIDSLMDVIRDRATDASERYAAIGRLSLLHTQLRDKKCIEELMDVYPTVDRWQEKTAILGCLIGSEDPRVLPLLYKVLNTEKDPVLRFGAADGLAQWNIRFGVKGLIALFPSSVKIGDRRLGYEAFVLFNRKNKLKGWGCPAEEIRAAIADLGDQAEEQSAKAVVERYRNWFEQNKHRFPDWRPGDPLPEIDCRSRESIAAEKGWKCDRSCASPADFDDCATCCGTHDSCTYCCSCRTRVFEQLTEGQRAECMSLCDLAFKP
ncbi:MAG: hypothetical protein WBE26_03435 [Phycisphaerae bacterium]